jgi:hypothetical protein
LSIHLRGPNFRTAQARSCRLKSAQDKLSLAQPRLTLLTNCSRCTPCVTQFQKWKDVCMSVDFTLLSTAIAEIECVFRQRLCCAIRSALSNEELASNHRVCFQVSSAFLYSDNVLSIFLIIPYVVTEGMDV